jgi:F-type H+-transporting ATPase subunit b
MFKRGSLILPLLTLLALAHPLLAAEGAEQQPGLIDFDLSAIIWVLISFTIVLVVLYKSAWKNVLAGLKAREEKISGDIKEAEAARAKAEALLKDHMAKLAGADDQIRQMLNKAAGDGEKIAAAIHAQAQADAEAERDKTRKEIEAAKREAIRQVYEQAADMATAVASKIIGRNLTAADQQDLVNQTLGQLEALGRK